MLKAGSKAPCANLKVHPCARDEAGGLSIANLGYHYAAWRHLDVAGRRQYAVALTSSTCAVGARRAGSISSSSPTAPRSADLDDSAIARELEHQLVKHEPLALGWPPFPPSPPASAWWVCTGLHDDGIEPFNVARWLTTAGTMDQPWPRRMEHGDQLQASMRHAISA